MVESRFISRESWPASGSKAYKVLETLRKSSTPLTIIEIAEKLKDQRKNLTTTINDLEIRGKIKVSGTEKGVRKFKAL